MTKAASNRPDTRKHLNLRPYHRKTSCIQWGVHTRTLDPVRRADIQSFPPSPLTLRSRNAPALVYLRCLDDLPSAVFKSHGLTNGMIDVPLRGGGEFDPTFRKRRQRRPMLKDIRLDLDDKSRVVAGGLCPRTPKRCDQRLHQQSSWSIVGRLEPIRQASQVNRCGVGNDRELVVLA